MGSLLDADSHFFEIRQWWGGSRQLARSDFCGLPVQRRIDLGGAGDDAALVTRRSGAGHASEARAKAASASRMAARSQSWATGQADAMAILMRRGLARDR